MTASAFGLNVVADVGRATGRRVIITTDHIHVLPEGYWIRKLRGGAQVVVAPDNSVSGWVGCSVPVSTMTEDGRVVHPCRNLVLNDDRACPRHQKSIDARRKGGDASG